MGDEIDDFGEARCAFSLNFSNGFHCHVRHRDMIDQVVCY